MGRKLRLVAEEIEKVRRELEAMAEEKASLSHPQVLALSQKLDFMINNYHKFTMRSIMKKSP